MMSLDSTKTQVQSAYENISDGMVVFGDVSIAVNVKKRNECLDAIHRFHVNSDEYRTLPVCSTVISNAARYILQDNSVIYVSLPDNLPQYDYEALQKINEEIDWCFIEYFEKNFEKTFQDMADYNFSIQNILYGTIDDSTLNTFGVLCSVLNVLSKIFPIKCDINKIEQIILDSLTIKSDDTDSLEQAAVNEFTTILNDMIQSERLKLVISSEEMQYVENSDQLVVWHDNICIEAGILEKVLLARMNVCSNTVQLCKALKQFDLLKATKKNQQPIHIINNFGQKKLISTYCVPCTLLTGKSINILEGLDTADYFGSESESPDIVPLFDKRRKI